MMFIKLMMLKKHFLHNYAIQITALLKNVWKRCPWEYLADFGEFYHTGAAKCTKDFASISNDELPKWKPLEVKELIESKSGVTRGDERSHYKANSRTSDTTIPIPVQKLCVNNAVADYNSFQERRNIIESSKWARWKAAIADTVLSVPTGSLGSSYDYDYE